VEAGVPSQTDHGFWAVDLSWSLLLAALALAPLLTANLSWIPGLEEGTWLHSGSFTLKSLSILGLVSAAFILYFHAFLRGRVTLRAHRVGWVAVAFFGWSAMATATSTSPGTSIIGAPGNASGLLALFSYVAAAFLVLQLADSPQRIRMLLRFAALSAALVAAYGIIQSIEEDLDPLTWGAKPWGVTRSFATMGNPDMFGAFMVLALFVIVGLWLSEGERAWRYAEGVAFLLVGTATFTSLTRAAWVGALVGVVAFALFAVRLRPKIGRADVVLALALAVCIAVMAVGTTSFADPDANVAERVSSIADFSAKSTVGRLETWRVSADALVDRPVTGWGPDNFQSAFESNRSEEFARLVGPSVTQASAHSTPVQIAVELGVVGAALWAGLLGAVAMLSARMIWAAAPKSRSALLVPAGIWASCAAYVTASLLSPASPPASLLLWSMLALLVSPLATPVTVAISRRVRSLTAAVGIVAGCFGAAVAVLFVLADTRAAAAANAALEPDRRVAAADSAIALNPLSPEYHEVRARAYGDRMIVRAESGADGSDDFEEALGAMRRAVDAEPENPFRRNTLVSLLLLGSEYVDESLADEALSVAEDSALATPYQLSSHYWYARALVSAGRLEDAVGVLEDVLALRPGYADAAVLLSDLYLQQGEESLARHVLEEALPEADSPDVRTWLDRLDGQQQ